MISGTTVEYPDMIGFAFNPCVVNVSGVAWDSVVAKITCMKNSESHSEEREMFGMACFFDLQHYVQGAFDDVGFSKCSYDNNPEDTGLGALFEIEVSFWKDEEVSDSMSFQTFFIWGAMQTGERYNGERFLMWFKKFPFTIGVYSGAKGVVQRFQDGAEVSSVVLDKQAVWNIPVVGLDADDELRIHMSANESYPATFDNTFDLTFRSVGGDSCIVHCKVDNSDEGIYLRWINRHGFYCYWLFANGDESRKVANDGEFLRNNMADYSVKSGYHGGTGRMQRKTGENSLPVCAPLVDSDVFDFLFELALSPVVDMYMGEDERGKPAWMRVNISVGTFTKTRKALQDFIATIVLPETRIPSL